MLSWYAQELPSSCVAACTRMVIEDLGQQLSEAVVRRLIGHTRLGISLGSAQAKLVEAGAIAEFHDDWNLDDLRDALRAGHHPIVGVERQPLGYPRAFHAIVLTEIISSAITALDPLDGPKSCQYGLVAFETAWEMAGREVLLIQKPPNF